MNLWGPMLLALRGLREGDLCEEWAPEVEPDEAAEFGACERERCESEVSVFDFDIVDLEAKAAQTRYRPAKGQKLGKVKRTRYPRINLAERDVIIGLHQPGVERKEERWAASAHRVTCHRFIGPTGVRYKVHPIDTHLLTTNRLNRKPYQCIAFEVAGNFERIDGTGTWWQPDRFGAGRATDRQLDSLFEGIRDVQLEVREAGGEVKAIVPHIIAGRSQSGKPNRQACCGSRVWQEAGERAGAQLGLAVPASGFSIGGLPVPEEWNGQHWPRCRKFWKG